MRDLFNLLQILLEEAAYPDLRSCLFSKANIIYSNRGLTLPLSHHPEIRALGLFGHCGTYNIGFCINSLANCYLSTL
jgi:hypothetical protein